MKILGWSLCWGVACQVDIPSPRPGTRTCNITGEKEHVYSTYSSAMVRKWKCFGIPMQMGHYGKIVGVIICGKVRRGNFLIFGICRAELVAKNPLLSIETVGVENNRNNVQLRHVAIVLGNLGAFDTFLKPGWRA